MKNLFIQSNFKHFLIFLEIWRCRKIVISWLIYIMQVDEIINFISPINILIINLITNFLF